MMVLFTWSANPDENLALEQIHARTPFATNMDTLISSPNTPRSDPLSRKRSLPTSTNFLSRPYEVRQSILILSQPTFTLYSRRHEFFSSTRSKGMMILAQKDACYRDQRLLKEWRASIQAVDKRLDMYVESAYQRLWAHWGSIALHVRRQIGFAEQTE